MAGDSIRASVRGVLVVAFLSVASNVIAADPSAPRGLFSGPAKPLFGVQAAERREAVDSIPFARLTAPAQQRILRIVNSPTLYRRLPVQSIESDRDLFLFLARHPEVLVGMWELMGITKVQIERTGPYHLDTEDGNGTACNLDLVYGDPHLHVFVAEGSYSGKLVTSPIAGQGVFVLRSSYARLPDGGTTVTGVLDCFIQLDSLGADLVARTFSGLIGKSADHNFTETAKFISQVSLASENNPIAMVDLATRLPQVDPQVATKFIQAIQETASRADDRVRTAARPASPTSR